MNREQDFQILPWEADEYVIAFKGKIVGRTLHGLDAVKVKSWIGTALDQIVAQEKEAVDFDLISIDETNPPIYP